jgi:hypothetical protein
VLESQHLFMFFFATCRNHSLRFFPCIFLYFRSAYGAAHENLQLVRQYGYTPSSETAAPEAATTNLGLVRSNGSDPSSATGVQSNVDGAAPTIYSYAGTPAITQAENVAAPSVYIAAAAPAYL